MCCELSPWPPRKGRPSQSASASITTKLRMLFIRTAQQQPLGAPGLAIFQTWVRKQTSPKTLERRALQHSSQTQVWKIARPGAPTSFFLAIKNSDESYSSPALKQASLLPIPEHVEQHLRRTASRVV